MPIKLTLSQTLAGLRQRVGTKRTLFLFAGAAYPHGPASQ